MITLRDTVVVGEWSDRWQHRQQWRHSHGVLSSRSNTDSTRGRSRRPTRCHSNRLLLHFHSISTPGCKAVRHTYVRILGVINNGLSVADLGYYILFKWGGSDW